MLQDDEEQNDMDATEEQIAELRRLGILDPELQGLGFADAEEWIDELRTRRIDAGPFGATQPRSTM